MRIVRLGDVCDVLGGKRIPKGEKLSDAATNHPYIRVSDFDGAGGVSTSSLKYVPDKVWGQISRYTISKDDVFLSIAGTIGVTGLIPDELDGANLTENACKLVIKSDLDKKYLYYFTLSTSFRSQTVAGIKQTAQPKLALARIKDIRIPLPPLEEQRRIVARLDAAFEKISAAEVLTRQNLDNVSALQKSTLHKYLSVSGSTHTDKLSVFFDVRDGTHDSPPYHATGYPLVTSKNLKTGVLSMDKVQHISELDYNKINERSKVHVGDVLMAMIGTIGNPILIEEEPEFAIKNVALFKSMNDNSGKFLKYYLQSEAINGTLQKDAKGTTQKFVSLGYLRALPFPDISPDKQHEVVKRIDMAMTDIEKLRSKYELKVEKTTQLRQSLLAEAFSTTNTV